MVDRAPSARVCLGIVGAAHGVRGAMKVKTFTEDPRDLAAYGPLSDASGTRHFTVTSCAADKAGARITLDGVTDRSAAEALRGTALYVARDKLPALADADDFYHADLIGLAALSPEGDRLGTVHAVHDFGAGDLLEIAGDDADPKTGKGTAFYPFTKQVVPQIDMAAGTLVLVPPVEDEARPPEQLSDKEQG